MVNGAGLEKRGKMYGGVGFNMVKGALWLQWSLASTSSANKSCKLTHLSRAFLQALVYGMI